MRRLAALLILLLLSPLAYGAARTASASGVWATALGATPTVADTCTINTGVSVDCPGTCTCGQIINNGSLFCSSPTGCTWTIGNGSAACAGDTSCAATDSYHGTGQWSVGYLDTVLVDVGTAVGQNTNATEIAPTLSTGTVIIQGKRIISGTVTSEDSSGAAFENCPQGSVAQDSNGNPLVDIAGGTPCAASFNVYVDIGRAVRENEFNGLVLDYTWPAPRRGTWYTILDTHPPNVLVLDANSRGQQRRHGYQETATATTNTGGDAALVSPTAGFSAFDTTNGKWPIGGWFFCTADCTAASISPDNGTSTDLATTENVYMPCTKARRIIAAPTASTLRLQNAYPAATCDAGAGATIVWEPGGWDTANLGGAGTVDDVGYVEGPLGPFIIIDPAIVRPLTLPADIDPPGANALSRQFFLSTANGGSFDIDYADLLFCGRNDATVVDADCLKAQYVQTNANGTVDIDWSEIGWYGGNMAISLQNVANDINFQGVSIRDALPTNQALPVVGDTGTAHGIRIMDNNSATIHNVTLDQISCRRMGDDCLAAVYDPDDAKQGGRTTEDYNNITVTRSTAVWASMVAHTAGAECWDMSTPSPGIGAGIEGTLKIDKMLCSNYHDDGIILGEDVGGHFGGVVISNSVFRNFSGVCSTGIAGASAPDITDYGSGFAVVNTYCSVPGVSSNGDLGGWYSAGTLYSNFIYSQNGTSSGQSAYGTTYVHKPSSYCSGGTNPGVQCPLGTECAGGGTCNVILGTGFDVKTAGEVGSQFPTTLTFRDDVCFNPSVKSGAICFSGVNGAGSPTVTVDHATHLGGGGSTEYLLRLYNTDFTMTNSVSGLTAGATIRQDDNDPACPTFTNDYNYFLRTPAGTADDCSVGASGCTCTFGSHSNPSNTLTGDLGILGFYSTTLPDLTISSRSTPMTSLGNDTYHKGARCSGPANWAILELVYPPLKSLGRPGVHDSICTDRDGDGIYDIHDTCDTDPNPLAASCE